MTKRRLIKLLMTGGLQRNEARAEAGWLASGLWMQDDALMICWAASRAPQYAAARHGGPLPYPLKKG